MRQRLLAAVLAAPLMMGASGAFAQSAAPAPAAPSVSPPQPVVTAALKTPDGADAGVVNGYEGPMGMIFRVEGKGWTPGWHAVHLHAVGSCEAPGFTSAGGHVNHAQGSRPHGLLNDEGGPDLGDLQNVYAHADGTANADVYLAWAGLDAHEEHYVDGDGLSFVVHANPDDYVSQPIGGAGARVACGVFQPAG